MKHVHAFVFSLVLAASPGFAQSPVSGDADDLSDGVNLMEEGARALLRGLLREMEPALEDLGQMAEDMGPAMEELRGLIGDFSAYHLPEVLPNGDIIIRRKSPLRPDEPGENGEIEL